MEVEIEMKDMDVKTVGGVKYTKSLSKSSPSRIIQRHSTNFIVSFGCLSLTLLLSITHGHPVTSLLTSSSSSLSVASPHTRHGYLRLQPELDKIDIDSYLKNTKALKLQVNCLIFDGACDWVGRWLKPRAAAAMLGECLVCTEHQKTQMPKIMGFIQVNFPDEFKLGIKKYLFQFGIQVPTEAPANTTTTTTTATTAAATITTSTTTETPGSQSLASTSTLASESTSSSTTSDSSSDYPPISSLNLKAEPEPEPEPVPESSTAEIGNKKELEEKKEGDKVKVEDKQKKEPVVSSDQTAKVTVAETTISP